MKPTIGRIVHYTSNGYHDGKAPPEIRAAIITGVNPATEAEAASVSLRVFTRMDDSPLQKVLYSDEPAGSTKARGCWSWPARETEAATDVVPGPKLAGAKVPPMPKQLALAGSET